jgi:heme o synthase
MINYYLITKPGIIMGNLVTLAAGFALGAKGHIDILLFLETLIGLALIIASACVFNNYIDREVDGKMSRTKQRALVKGIISGANALAFATLLGILGFAVLYAFTNVLALGIAALGFFTYVLLYSFWKSKTVFATAIGSVAGAVPPVVGYCAAGGGLDMGAALLFGLLVLWQMPHFFAIAIMYLEDYKKANIPVLPVVKGITRTKVHALLYIIVFIPVTMMLTFMGYTGNYFLAAAAVLGFAWFVLSILGFSATDNKRWAKSMFQLSLVIISVLCLIIPFDIA